MNGMRFLLSTKDVICSEKILKIKMPIDASVKASENNSDAVGFLKFLKKNLPGEFSCGCEKVISDVMH